jgi:hypothetical protein
MGLWRAWRAAGFTLHAPLPPAECLARLRAEVSPSWQVFGGKAVVGRIGRDWIWLRMRGPAMARNAMQPHLFARLHPAGAGTSLRARFLIHPLVITILLMWLAIAVILLGNLLGAIGGTAPGAVVPSLLAIAAALAGIVVIGRHFARNDRAALLAFLETTIGARPPG